MRKSYVYKITCLVTGEYYFGSSFSAKSDRYWGGGKRIRERIAQYGKENFIKEILGEFDDRTESHRVENQYIEKFRHDDKCLNIACDHKFGRYDEESTSKTSQKLKDYYSIDSNRKKISEKVKNSDKRKQVMASKEYRHNVSQGLLKSEKFQKAMHSAEFSEKCRNKALKYYENENNRKSLADEKRKFWSDPKNREKMLLANHSQERKDKFRKSMSKYWEDVRSGKRFRRGYTIKKDSEK